MIVWVVSRKNVNAYNKTGSYKGFNCYYFEHEIYNRMKNFQGHLFLSAEKAIEYMAREGKKYGYRGYNSGTL